MWWLCPHDGTAVLGTEPQGAPSPHACEVAVETLATRKWAVTGLDRLVLRSWASCLECEKKISVVYKRLILRYFCHISPSRHRKLLPRSGGTAVTSKTVDVALLPGGRPRLGLLSACQKRSASSERAVVGGPDAPGGESGGGPLSAPRGHEQQAVEVEVKAPRVEVSAVFLEPGLGAFAITCKVLG